MRSAICICFGYKLSSFVSRPGNHLPQCQSEIAAVAVAFVATVVAVVLSIV